MLRRITNTRLLPQRQHVYWLASAQTQLKEQTTCEKRSTLVSHFQRHCSKKGEKANNACQSLSSLSVLPVFDKATAIRYSRPVCSGCRPPSAQGFSKVSRCCCCKHPQHSTRHTNEQSFHRCLFLTSEIGVTAPQTGPLNHSLTKLYLSASTDTQLVHRFQTLPYVKISYEAARIQS